MEEKVCKSCKSEKSLEKFDKEKRCLDGRTNTCKQCRRDKGRKIPISPVGMQFCRKCNTHKTLDKFELCKGCSSGHRYRCKKCRNGLYVKKGRSPNQGFQKGRKKTCSKSEIKKGERRGVATEFKKGQKPHNFIDGLTEERYRIITTRKYAKIRSEVLERDSNTCLICGKTDIPLQVHHKVPIRVDSDLAYEKKNLMTLCIKCHTKEDREYKELER